MLCKPNSRRHFRSRRLYSGLRCEFKSEGGFGNDRLDIYSFSLESTPPDGLFSPYDENGKLKYENFEYMTELETGDEDADLRTSVEELMQAQDLTYLYITNGGTQKLYLYSNSVNLGYCLILTI